MLEITVWDQPRVQEEESEFLGEVSIRSRPECGASCSFFRPSPFMPRRHPHGESASKKLQRSQRISDSDMSDYEVDDAIGVVPPVGYRSSTRESKPSTLTVPEQQRTTHHRSRSVSPHRGDDQGRPRSRLPNVPLQRTHRQASPSRSPPTDAAFSSRRGRQLPQVPVRSGSIEQASLVVEERTRQMKMKVHRFKQTTGSGSSQELDREQYSKYSAHTDQYRSCDNVSARSSDSDVSDASAVSRTSSASRLSSTSFLSEQSERPRGRIRFTKMFCRNLGKLAEY
ncbi:hypothetical protein K5549_003177 [Capra hircus]|nr:hypothetical protein K5549_003177 [Capra hircus]